jgi:hypothetical protein
MFLFATLFVFLSRASRDYVRTDETRLFSYLSFSAGRIVRNVKTCFGENFLAHNFPKRDVARFAALFHAAKAMMIY